MVKIFEKIILTVVVVLFVGMNALFISGSLTTGEQVTDAAAAQDTPTVKQRISLEEARNIALTQLDGEVIETERGKYGGKEAYEVEITKDDLSVEIIIDAYSGRVIAIEDEDEPDEKVPQEELETLQRAGGILTESAAREIALNAVGGDFRSIDSEREGGRVLYEVQLFADGEYVEVEIDAETGEILEVEYGEDDD